MASTATTESNDRVIVKATSTASPSSTTVMGHGSLMTTGEQRQRTRPCPYPRPYLWPRLLRLRLRLRLHLSYLGNLIRQKEENVGGGKGELVVRRAWYPAHIEQHMCVYGPRRRPTGESQDVPSDNNDAAKTSFYLGQDDTDDLSRHKPASADRTSFVDFIDGTGGQENRGCDHGKETDSGQRTTDSGQRTADSERSGDQAFSKSCPRRPRDIQASPRMSQEISKTPRITKWYQEPLRDCRRHRLKRIPRSMSSSFCKCRPRLVNTCPRVLVCAQVCVSLDPLSRRPVILGTGVDIEILASSMAESRYPLF